MKKKLMLEEYKNGNSKENFDIEISIPEQNEKYHLRLIASNFKKNIPNCAMLLSKWRIENPLYSPAVFNVTEKRTESWIENSVLKDKNRFLFMIQNEKEENYGHIGLSQVNYESQFARVDCVMKGKDGPKNLMKYAMDSLINWANLELDISLFDLVVLSNNTRAINFYKKCGFREDNIISLKKITDGNEVSYVEDDIFSEDAEKFYLHMIKELT